MTNDASSAQPETRANLKQALAYTPDKTAPGTLKIASNEIAQPPLPSVVKAIPQIIASPTTSPNRYPDVSAVDLRIKLDEHLGLPMEQVAAGCGSSAPCLQLVQAACTDGDEIVFPWHSFETYPILACVAGAIPMPAPLGAQGRNNLSAMAAAITDRTRLAPVCSPNNPTGTTIIRETFTEFMVQVPGNVVVVLDEAYIELMDEAAHAVIPLVHELPDIYPNLVGLHTFPKVYGLAGFRVGYMFSPEKLVEVMNKVTTPLPVSTPTQITTLASLNAQEELSVCIAEVHTQHVTVTKAINAATGRKTVLPNPQANFIQIGEGRVAGSSLLDNASAATATDLGDFLAQRSIPVRCFAGEGARITITTEEETSQLLVTLRIER